MLIKDLKNEIKKYNKKELESIIVELYKRLPKSKKEDYDIDNFIKNMETGEKPVKVKQSFDELYKEIVYFINCVDNEYYACANRIISKKERSSWRFKVKRYYKELNSIPFNEQNGIVATTLLIEIFKRLSIGSNRLLFVNWETFKALGVSQTEYYDTIINRIMANGYSKENLQKCINLLDILKDPYDLSYGMFKIFIYNLKTTEEEELAIELLNTKVQQQIIEFKNLKDNNRKYTLKENINNYVECIIEIYFNLNEIDKGIKYFHKYYIQEIREVKEYILLEKLDELNLTKEWLNEYESHMDKIDYRESLKDKYKELKHYCKICKN